MIIHQEYAYHQWGLFPGKEQVKQSKAPWKCTGSASGIKGSIPWEGAAEAEQDTVTMHQEYVWHQGTVFHRKEHLE
jgi:hypothetical protein